MRDNLLLDAGRLIRSWLQIDRVRAAPSLGCLLNLEPGAEVLYKQELLVISSREILADSQQVRTSYSLSQKIPGGREAMSMIVTVATIAPFLGSIVFVRGSRMTEAYYGEVVVLKNRGAR